MRLSSLFLMLLLAAPASAGDLTAPFNKAVILQATAPGATSVEWFDYIPSNPGSHPLTFEVVSKNPARVRVTWTGVQTMTPTVVQVYCRASFPTQAVPSEAVYEIAWTPVGWTMVVVKGKVE